MSKSKVAIMRCTQYNVELIKEQMRQAIDLLGGFSQVIGDPNKSILLKPNMLTDRTPEQATTTHPEFIRAIIQLLKEYGVKDIRVGDSPSGMFKKAEFVYEKTELTRVAREENVQLVTFEKGKTIEGKLIAQECLDADMIINLPKAKTHTLTSLTGAIKNMYGVVPGFAKVQYHLDNPFVEKFVNVILHVYSLCTPHLTLMDAIVGMQGNGPANGKVREIGLVLVSQDAVSLDAVFAKIVGLDPKDLLFLKRAHAQKLGNSLLENIEVFGQSLESIQLHDFELPKSTMMMTMPEWLLKSIGHLMHFSPVIDQQVCKKCNRCFDVCPAHAIHKKETSLIIQSKECIRCFCCHEVCPYDAIEVKRNIFARLLSKNWKIKKTGENNNEDIRCSHMEK